MATLLREMYHVLGCFNTAAHTAMCSELLVQLRKGKQRKDNLAAYFADALNENEHIKQVEQPFIPSTRKTDKKGTNPVAEVMKLSSPITITQPHNASYSFSFLQREIPHLRAKTNIEQRGKAWMDYVAHQGRRPILGEIKWKGDKNPFFAFVQLLTYLSEMATPDQIERAVKHKLFGEGITSITAFDLHIFLGNFNDRGDKGPLIDLTRQLADIFKQRLKNDHPESAKCLGNVLCISGHIEDESKRFSSKPHEPKCLWVV